MQTAQKIKPSFRRLMIKWLQDSSSHGIPHIMKSDYVFLKIIWFLFFCLSTGYCIYFIKDTFVDYMGNRVQTLINVVQDTPAIFPAISICNINPFKSDDEEIINELRNKLKEFDVIDDPNLYSADLRQQSDSKSLRSFIINLPDSNKSRYGYTAERMFIQSKLNGFPLRIDRFEWYYDFDYGNCYKFNANPNNLTIIGREGHKSGLELEIYIGNRSKEEPFINRRGIRILIFNHTIPEPCIGDDGIDVPPGKVTSLSIKRTFYERLGEPYNGCVQIYLRKILI